MEEKGEFSDIIDKFIASCIVREVIRSEINGNHDRKVCAKNIYKPSGPEFFMKDSKAMNKEEAKTKLKEIISQHIIENGKLPCNVTVEREHFASLVVNRVIDIQTDAYGLGDANRHTTFMYERLLYVNCA